MLGFEHLPGHANEATARFDANSPSPGQSWGQYLVPRWARMLHILAWGGGGSGGNGVVGANSTAAGGGGGGSGGQTSVLIPTSVLPEQLFVSVGYGGNTAAGINTYVAIYPDVTANHCVARANGGSVGGNAAGATAGAAGAAGAVATIATMPIAGMGSYIVLAGQAGIIGGTTGAGAALTLPVTGICVTGGTGGAGLGAAASTGLAGGAINAAGQFMGIPGGTGTAVATTPPGDGNGGFSDLNDIEYRYGGTGGGATHGTATGAGLVGARGGDGGLGCGGGGGGGALTGSTQGLRGMGGGGLVLITAL